MVELKKESSLFMRDSDGKLLPQKVNLEFLDNKPEITVLPMMRGDIQEIGVMEKSDVEKEISIILNYCISPKFTEIEAKDIKPSIAGAIVTAILAVSLDMTQAAINKMAEDRLSKDFLSKQQE